MLVAEVRYRAADDASYLLPAGHTVKRGKSALRPNRLGQAIDGAGEWPEARLAGVEGLTEFSGHNYLPESGAFSQPFTARHIP
jgi:hypothetical protein